jgi:hypothetical protein
MTRTQELDNYETAIARRNIAWAKWRNAIELLRHAEARDEDSVPYRRVSNAAQHDYEWAARDLVRARVWFAAGLVSTVNAA